MTDGILLGTQSWNYKAWVGPFYPPGTKGTDMLSFYSRVFRTIEVDATFYGIPAEPVLKSWAEQVTPGFQFALKVPQQVTHDRRLVETRDVIDKFVARVSTLSDHLGPLLLQMSPDFIASGDNREALKAFLKTLPREVRWAIEFRTSAWITNEVLDLLDNHGVALTLTDSRWHKRERMLDLVDRPTSSFTYIRWMGSDRGLTDFSKPQLDRREDLEAWSDALSGLRGGYNVVYGYFNNQFEGHGPHSTREMQRLLGLPSVDPRELHPQVDMF